MSGENIYNLMGSVPVNGQDKAIEQSAYTGKYTKHMDEMSKPSYSTFFERGKEYDGTHPRYFKQRDAIIGPSVNESVDPKNFLRVGGGVKFSVPPVHEKKTFTKAPLDRRGRKGEDSRGNFSSTYPHLGHGQTSSGLEKDHGTGLNGNDMEKSPVQNFYSATHAGGCDGEQREGGMAGNGISDNIYNVEGGQPSNIHGDYRQAKGGLCGANGVFDNNNGSRENVGDLYGPGSLGGKKDFVTSNIIEISNLVPKRRKDQPEFPTCRKSFGKPPVYLDRVKKEIQGEKDYLKSLEDAQAERARKQMEKYVYRLDEAERLALIAKLKTKLTETTAFLNTIPFAKDTVSQVKRKADIESKIKEIESALAKLNKDAIFVYQDDPAHEQWAKNTAFAEARRYAALHAE